MNKDSGVEDISDFSDLSTSSSSKNMSAVGQMFHGRSVFITGASGFIGRVLVEKLLRTYQGIERIYILLRPKKNQNPYDRLNNQLLKVPLFDKIRSLPNGEELLSKLVVIPGDISEPRLGISDEDYKRLLDDPTLSIVFHSAATIKFDEPLKVSVKLNLIATRDIVDLCRNLKNLISFCHVSTAYVNSDILDLRTIEEIMYPMDDKPEDLIKLSELMDTDLMQDLKVRLVNRRPNTYTYTKALAEHLIAKEAKDLPVCIVRPSIVVAAWREPLKGWIDNLNGPTGLILAIGKGLLRTMVAYRDVVADVIPVDIVVNTMIGSAYYAAKVNNKLTGSPFQLLANVDSNFASSKQDKSGDKCATIENSILEKKPLIVHCNSGQRQPITWGRMEDFFFPIIRHYPSAQVLRYPFGSFKQNKYYDLFIRLFAHYLPALIIDMICSMMGKKRQLLSIYNKLHAALSALNHFCTHGYKFETKNLNLVESSLNEYDKQELYTDIKDLDWFNFWHSYVLGARRYVLKEPDDSLPKARVSFRRAYWIEMAFRTLAIGLILWLCLPSFVQLGDSFVKSAAHRVQILI